MVCGSLVFNAANSHKGGKLQKIFTFAKSQIVVQQIESRFSEKWSSGSLYEVEVYVYTGHP